MHAHTTLAGLLTLATLTCTTTAQVVFDPNIGAPLSAGDDTLSEDLALGFSFPFPNGTSTTTIDVDSNGRILLPDSSASDFSETLGEFLANPTSICPMWDDISMIGVGDDIYFNTTATSALVTWNDARLFNDPRLFTFQVQLHDDGRIGIFYDSRSAHVGPLIGITGGNGAGDPGQVDYSRGGTATAGGDTVYEIFPLFTLTFDLADSWIEFAPDGSGGYDVTSPRLADADPYGPSCRRTIQYTPDGVGGYIVTDSPDAFDPAVGTSLGITDDDQILPNVPLGFSFPFPGGSTVTSIDVDSNGRILPGNAGENPDFSPTAAEMLALPVGTIAPFWTDFDIRSGGDITMATTASTATLTWNSVAQFHGVAERGITAQVELDVSGAIRFTFVTAPLWDGQLLGLSELIIGISEGNDAADPGAIDYSTALPLSSGATVYEFWDGAVDDLDIQFSLQALNTPKPASSWDLQLFGIPSGSIGAFVLIGFSNPNLDLDLVPILGLPGCTLLTSATVPAITVPFSGPTSNVLSINLGPNPNAIGTTAFLQAATITPGLTPLGIVLSNGVEGFVGN